MAEWDNIVTVRSRTGKNEEFSFDGRPYIIDAKKGIKVPRYIADYALRQNPLKWSLDNGAVVDSKVYIEEDEPTTPTLVTAEDIAESQATGGMGRRKQMVDGKPVPMKTIDLGKD